MESGRAKVMPEKSSQKSLAANWYKVRSLRCHVVVGWPGRSLRDGEISEPLVRAMDIVITSVVLADVIEMTKAEAQEMIQALPLDRANPCFRKGVGVRGQ